MGFTGGYYTGGGNSAGTVMAILLLLAVVLTVLAFIFIVPENRREKLSAFGKFLHDTCNFNSLYPGSQLLGRSGPDDHHAHRDPSDL